MAIDLSTRHEPVSGLFAPLIAANDWSPFALTAEQLDFYHENGYVAGMRLLDDEQIAVLRAELDDLVDPTHDGREYFHEYHSNESTDPSTVLFHALGAWRVKPSFHDLLWNPRFLVPAAQLVGGAVRFWHDQLFVKPAKHGGVVAWHQDYSYWTRTTPMCHLTCWIGLDDTDENNGCLQYIPGSHRWDLLPITGLAGDMNAIQSVLTPEQAAAFKPVPIRLKAGQCSFHHPLLIHGSYENRTDGPRRAVVLNVFRDGVLSDKSEPLLAGIDAIPAGQPMSGQFFPLLYQATAHTMSA